MALEVMVFVLASFETKVNRVASNKYYTQLNMREGG